MLILRRRLCFRSLVCHDGWDPYESYSDRDGGQGGEEGMNTIDERVSRRCIGDLNVKGGGIGQFRGIERWLVTLRSG